MRRAMSLAAVMFFLAFDSTRGEVASGPAVGEKLAPFKAHVLGEGGNFSEADIVTDRGDKPTIYAFVRADRWDRPQARFLKNLDGVMEKHSAEAVCVVVWLTANIDESKEYLPRMNQSLQFQRSRLTVFSGDATGPEGWGINGDAFVTVVVAAGGKSAATMGLVSTNEGDVPKVEEALGKAVRSK